jgi:hypothetical protein
MPGWAWILVVLGALLVVALVVARGLQGRRTKSLQERFGPEYDRAVEDAESRRDAEADLRARADRRDELDIQPLPTAARERYVVEWQRVQGRFVDDPEGAVRDADMTIQSVMADRGYPMDDFEQRAADISVDYPNVVENYRLGHRLARASALGDGTTEDLRQAMQHYRLLFEELVEPPADAALARDDTAGVQEEARETRR